MKLFHIHTQNCVRGSMCRVYLLIKANDCNISILFIINVSQTKTGSVMMVIVLELDLQNLSPLKLRVQIPLMAGVLDATICDKVCQ